jgi:hypothetical protein
MCGKAKQHGDSPLRMSWEGGVALVAVLDTLKKRGGV